MSAVPNPSPRSNRDLIGRFREEYAEALAEARTGSIHTQTDGWRNLYAFQRQVYRDSRRATAQRLTTMATQLEDFGFCEDDEKALKTLAKDIAERRIEFEVFNDKTVGRVCEPVSKCERVIEQYRAQAARDEAAAPLHNVGLEELVRIEISKVAKPWFNAETGVIEIREPTP